MKTGHRIILCAIFVHCTDGLAKPSSPQLPSHASADEIQLIISKAGHDALFRIQKSEVGGKITLSTKTRKTKTARLSKKNYQFVLDQIQKMENSQGEKSACKADFSNLKIQRQGKKTEFQACTPSQSKVDEAANLLIEALFPLF